MRQRLHEAEGRYEEAVGVAPLCMAYNGLSNALEGQAKHAEARAACLRGAERRREAS